MLKIRLRRMGSRHRPFYRVVVSDSRRAPTATAVEELGFYNPTVRPAELKLDLEKFDGWVSKGARPSETVKNLAVKLRKGVPVGKVDEAAAEREAADQAKSKAIAEAKAAEAEAEEEAAKAKEEAAKAAEKKAEEKTEAKAEEAAEEKAEKKAEKGAGEAAAEGESEEKAEA